MTKTDLSTKVLLVRKMLAEKATPGPWLINDRNTSTPFDISIKNGTCFCQIVWGTKRQDITHIAANSPDVVIATIGELLRLREEKERLEKEADWLAERLAKYCVDDAEKECPLIDVCPEGSCPTITTSSWREAARRAVEEA